MSRLGIDPNTSDLLNQGPSYSATWASWIKHLKILLLGGIYFPKYLLYYHFKNLFCPSIHLIQL